MKNIYKIFGSLYFHKYFRFFLVFTCNVKHFTIIVAVILLALVINRQQKLKSANHCMVHVRSDHTNTVKFVFNGHLSDYNFIFQIKIFKLPGRGLR